MSDSDPEGDILNLEDILKNCKNVNLKKKITMNIYKKPSTPIQLKKKKVQKIKSDLRKTCPSKIKSNRSSSVSL
jgi:hypothetical protein